MPGAPPSAALTTLDAKSRQEVLGALSAALRGRYIFPDAGARAAAKIDAALAAGDYEVLADPAAFAGRVLADVQSVVHDKHLRLWANNAPPMPDAAGPTPMPPADSGIVRADRLTGGLGYIELVGFPPPPMFKPAIDRAMSTLAGSRALIIDMRRNGGGAAGAAAYLASFLVAPDLPLNDIVARVENSTDFTRESSRSVPTPVRFSEVPVYILTSEATFSAGEAFTYAVQALKRATVIGDVTGGGANPIRPMELVHGFAATIPVARAENPITKTNWEGSGVQPDVRVAGADALAAALERAGQKPVSTIEAASLQRLFAPRSTPLPGSEMAVRTLFAGLATGKPDYDAMAPGFATMTRQMLPALQGQIAALGDLQSMTFRGPDMMGGDEYLLHFARGDWMMALMLSPDGKVMGMSTLMPVPPGQAKGPEQ